MNVGGFIYLKVICYLVVVTKLSSIDDFCVFKVFFASLKSKKASVWTTCQLPVLSFYRPIRALQESQLQTPTVQPPPPTLPKQHSLPTPSPLSLLALPPLLLLTPLAALWPNPRPQCPPSLPPSPPRVQLVS